MISRPILSPLINTWRAYASAASGNPGPVVVVHGGAWEIPDSLEGDSVLGVEKAAEAARVALAGGASALDAVELAVSHLEDDPAFDAGRGSVLNAEGQVEMDALIVDGTTTRFGAVAGVAHAANPVQLARLVMERTPHAMLAGAGANAFAQAAGVPLLSTEELVTDEARRQYEEYRQYGHVVGGLFSAGHDTVGAVALDQNGRLAAATSTGGISCKLPGRIGDSPLIGCGAWARNAVGAASATGHGEAIMRVLLCRDVMLRVERDGVSVQEAVVAALDAMRHTSDVLGEAGGCGGVVALDARGAAGVWCTTGKMAWALARVGGGKVHAGIRRPCAAQQVAINQDRSE